MSGNAYAAYKIRIARRNSSIIFKPRANGLFLASHRQLYSPASSEKTSITLPNMTSLTPSLPSPLPDLPKVREDLETRIYNHVSSTSSVTSQSYKRLGFLGDVSLHLAISHILYNRTDNLDNHEMTELRKLYVAKGNLALWGRAYHFDDKVNVGNALLPLTAEHRDKFAGETFEAYLGALYLESQEVVTGLVGKLMLPGLETARRGIQEPPVDKNALQTLNEMLRRLDIDFPEYDVKDTKKPGPAQFDVVCRVAETVVSQANGKGKAEAKRRAAEKALGKGEMWLATLRPQVAS